MLPPTFLSRHPASVAASAAGAASLLGLGLWAILRKRPTAAEREERRRRHLSQTGRIVDGAITGAEPGEEAPDVILYRYRIAGVTYECSQDVSGLTPPPRDLRLEFPIQVRYDRTNPGDSIVVAEDWNGLWSRGQYKHDSGTRVRSQ